MKKKDYFPYMHPKESFFEKIGNFFSNSLPILIYMACLGSVVFGGGGLMNHLMNNKKIVSPSSQTHFYTEGRGLFGHGEFTQYFNGGYDHKTFGPTGFNDMVLSQDLDGDNKVDKIIIESGIWKTFEKALIRESDYNFNKEIFDKEDKKLKDAIDKYLQ